MCVYESCSRLLGLTTREEEEEEKDIGRMSEGESKQAPDAVQEGKPESMAAAPTTTGQGGAGGGGVSSVSPPVSMVTQSPATAATEDEEEESEDESEILEESPCGRWQKRREEVEGDDDIPAEESGLSSSRGCAGILQLMLNFVVFLPKVNQRNVPGIDNAYLAMDTEEGVEVVWNEVMFSERKNFKLQEVGTELV